MAYACAYKTDYHFEFTPKIISTKKIDPVKLGEYTAYFVIKSVTKVGSNASRIKILMKLMNHQNPGLLFCDKRRVTIKARKTKESKPTKLGYKFNEFQEGVVVYDRDMFHNKSIFLTVTFGASREPHIRWIKLEDCIRQENEKRMKYYSKNGNVKVLFQVEENVEEKESKENLDINIQEPPPKKRKLNNNESELSLDDAGNNSNKNNKNKNNNFIFCNETELILQSDYFDRLFRQNEMGKTWIDTKQKMIKFPGNKRMAEQFVSFIYLHCIYGEFDLLKFLQIAYLYKMKTLKVYLVRDLMRNVNLVNYVNVANNWVRFEMEDGYDELIEFGKEHVKKLRTSGKWSELNWPVKQAIRKK